LIGLVSAAVPCARLGGGVDIVQNKAANASTTEWVRSQEGRWPQTLSTFPFCKLVSCCIRDRIRGAPATRPNRASILTELDNRRGRRAMRYP
jgi:hypothetical protein